MTPAPKYHSDSRVMEAYGEVKKEPVVVVTLKEVGRLVKRKRAPFESEQGQKRSNGVNSTSRASSKTKSFKENGALTGKRKRPIVAAAVQVDTEMDSEHVMNAAQALFELFGGGGTSSQKESPDSKLREAVTLPVTAGGVKWAGKKSRSSRSKKADDCACKLSSSSTTSATVTDIPEVLDSSTSHNHVKASHHPVTVNLEDESEADADAKSTDMSPCGLGFGLDRGHRLLSQSSVESTLLDSRAESPSSPLRVLRPDAALIPKLEEELMLQFGFQKQAPVTKPSILRKPKVEENCAIQLDELKEVKIALKQVQRRKSRASNLKGTPLLLQGDVLDVPIASSATLLKECIEENKFQVPVTLNLFEPVKQETGRVKVEGRELYQTGSSTQVRLRSALSEAEKEARRLRRVQANRESARQTIRRKQVLCEELARKAGELQAEKDTLALSLETKSKELRNHQEINRHLKEQILAQGTNAEPPVSTAKTNSKMTSSPVPATTGPIQGMPMLPYWWAFALAQSVAAATSQSAAGPPQMGCEPVAAAAAAGAALPSDFNTVFAATVAALNSGAGLNSNMWVNMMGNNPGTVPPLDANHQPTLAHSAPRATEASPPKPDGTAERTPMPVNSHPYQSSSPVKAGMTNHVSQMNGKIPAGLPNNLNSRVKYQLSNNQAPSPLVRSVSGMHVPGDGMATASTTLSLGLGAHSGRTEQQQMRKSGNLRFFPTIGNGVQGFLGPRLGVYQSEAAAMATEARRRRRELKRTKSLQNQLQQEKKLASVKSL